MIGYVYDIFRLTLNLAV